MQKDKRGIGSVLPDIAAEKEECNKLFDDAINMIKKQKGYIVDIPLLKKAYDCARELHNDQRRNSGVLYLRHPLAVMESLSRLRCKTSVLAAGLLHDVMEDCECPYDVLRGQFSYEIAEIVFAVTEIKKQERAADKRLALMSENDIHDFLDTLTDAKLIKSKYQREAFLVRFADREHNLSTLDACNEAQQKKKIESTRIFLIPAAKRLGMNYFETVLSDYCLKYDDATKAEYAQILEMRNEFAATSGHAYSLFEDILSKAIESQNDFSLPKYNPFVRLRGGKSIDDESIVLAPPRRMLRVNELKKQMDSNTTFDRSTLMLNEVILTCKEKSKGQILAAFVKFHAEFLKQEHVFFEILNDTGDALQLKLTDFFENNYRLLIIPEQELEHYFIGNSNGEPLTMISEEAPTDALRQQITIYTYYQTERDGHGPEWRIREYRKCVPKGATALDFAFIASPSMAFTIKNQVKIRHWDKETMQPFSDSAPTYPLNTVLNDGDIVHFIADYSNKPEDIQNHAEIDWFAYVNTEYAKRCLIWYFKSGHALS